MFTSSECVFPRPTIVFKQFKVYIHIIGIR